MVAIERETPGIMAMHWKKPIFSARCQVIDWRPGRAY